MRLNLTLNLTLPDESALKAQMLRDFGGATVYLAKRDFADIKCETGADVSLQTVRAELLVHPARSFHRCLSLGRSSHAGHIVSVLHCGCLLAILPAFRTRRVSARCSALSLRCIGR